VSEQPVFWLGGKPGNSLSKRPDAERYEPAIREACEACGYDVDEYVAAQGAHGGWLVHLREGGDRYRLFWNGQRHELVLDRVRANGGWERLRAADTADEGIAGFVTALRVLLTGDKEA
jgi:hypothetical protein